MPTFLQRVSARLSDLRARAAIYLGIGIPGALLIDRGRGLLYDVERNITWLQDANYAKTAGRSPDGQLNWHDARAWVGRLNYRGITGWRLPDARAIDGSGPREGENNAEGEIGHLFIVAARRMSPPDLRLTNFEPFSIYWYRNEASDADAYTFKLVGLRQGRLPKDPWHGEISVPPADKVLAWPVHDGDVSPGLFVRFVDRLTDALFTRASSQRPRASGAAATRRRIEPAAEVVASSAIHNVGEP